MTKYVTVPEASKIVKRATPLIYTRIKEGKLQSLVGDDGVMRIDVEAVKASFANVVRRNRRKPSAQAIATAPAPVPAISGNNHPLKRLTAAAQARFGRYTPSYQTLLNAAVELAITDMEGRVTVREAA